jgi:hypothetical protein
VVAALHIMALFVVQLQWVQDFLTTDCNYCRLVNQKVHILILLSPEKDFSDISGSSREINYFGKVSRVQGAHVSTIEAELSVCGWRGGYITSSVTVRQRVQFATVQFNSVPEAVQFEVVLS